MRITFPAPAQAKEASLMRGAVGVMPAPSERTVLCTEGRRAGEGGASRRVGWAEGCALVLEQVLICCGWGRRGPD